MAARWLELADQNARHLLESLRIEAFETEERAEDPVYALSRELGLTHGASHLHLRRHLDQPGARYRRIAGYVRRGRPRKAEYRKFRIQGPAQQDDFAAIHEVVLATSVGGSTKAKPLPDLVMIDGGKGQLSAALGLDDADRRAGDPLISLAKREEIYFPDRPDPLRLPRQPALRLLQRAATRHIASASPTTGSAAPSGPSPRRCSTSRGSAQRGGALLQTFGSLAGVRAATPSDVAALPSFPEALASRILDYLKAH